MSVITGLKGFNQDDVTVAMKCKHDVAVTRQGTDGKPAHVISILFTDRLNDYIEFIRCRYGDITGEWDTSRVGLYGVVLRLVERTP